MKAAVCERVPWQRLFQRLAPYSPQPTPRAPNQHSRAAEQPHYAIAQDTHQSLGSARHPLHYLAIPPSLFETVIEGLGNSGCADGARVVVETKK